MAASWGVSSLVGASLSSSLLALARCSMRCPYLLSVRFHPFFLLFSSIFAVAFLVIPCSFHVLSPSPWLLIRSFLVAFVPLLALFPCTMCLHGWIGSILKYTSLWLPVKVLFRLGVGFRSVFLTLFCKFLHHDCGSFLAVLLAVSQFIALLHCRISFYPRNKNCPRKHFSPSLLTPCNAIESPTWASSPFPSPLLGSQRWW